MDYNQVYELIKMYRFYINFMNEVSVDEASERMRNQYFNAESSTTLLNRLIEETELTGLDEIIIEYLMDGYYIANVAKLLEIDRGTARKARDRIIGKLIETYQNKWLTQT